MKMSSQTQSAKSEKILVKYGDDLVEVNISDLSDKDLSDLKYKLEDEIACINLQSFGDLDLSSSAEKALHARKKNVNKIDHEFSYRRKFKRKMGLEFSFFKIASQHLPLEKFEELLKMAKEDVKKSKFTNDGE